MVSNQGVDISPRRQGILCVKRGHEIWGEGVRTQDTGDSEMLVQVVTIARPKYALELFSGTGSTTKVLEQHGYTVISLDSDPKYNATIVGSILDWDYGAYASPPCTDFSQAKTNGQRDLKHALSLVQRTLEIISYFQPDRW